VFFRCPPAVSSRAVARCVAGSALGVVRVRGSDTAGYPRALYAPHPILSGLVTAGRWSCRRAAVAGAARTRRALSAGHGMAVVPPARPGQPPRPVPVWPLWFAALAVVHLRVAGPLLVLGLAADCYWPTSRTEASRGRRIRRQVHSVLIGRLMMRSSSRAPSGPLCSTTLMTKRVPSRSRSEARLRTAAGAAPGPALTSMAATGRQGFRR
jgi:hypothetical protein